MRSLRAPADAGQLCAEILGDFVAAQQRLYSGASVPQPRVELHTEADGLVSRDRAELALVAGANVVRRHVEDLTGDVLSINEARSILKLALDAWIRVLDGGKAVTR